MKLVYHRVTAVAAAVFLSTALMVPDVQGFTLPLSSSSSSSSKLVSSFRLLDLPASLFGDNGQINFHPPAESYTDDDRTILKNSKQQSWSSNLAAVVQEPLPTRTVTLENTFFSPPPTPFSQSQTVPSFDSQQQPQQILSSIAKPPQVKVAAAPPPQVQAQPKAQPQGQAEPQGQAIQKQLQESDTNFYTLLGVLPTYTHEELQTKYMEWVETQKQDEGVATPPPSSAIFAGSLFQAPPNQAAVGGSTSSSSVPVSSSIITTTKKEEGEEDEELRRVEEAWKILSNPESRHRYDAELLARQRYEQELQELLEASSSSSSGRGPWNPLDVAAAEMTYDPAETMTETFPTTTTDLAVVDKEEVQVEQESMAPSAVQEEENEVMVSEPVAFE